MHYNAIPQRKPAIGMSLLSFILVLWAFGGGVVGQGAGGAIRGIVVDAQGAAILGARVKVRHLDTGMRREVETEEEGQFRVSNLAPGQYEVEVEREGFQRVLQRVRVGVGQEVWVEVRLPVGTITESVVVSGEEGQVLEPTRTELSQAVVPVQLQQLPVRGRDFADLTLLTPRVIQSDRSSQGSAQQTFGMQFLQLSFSGVRNQYNLLLVDGADATWHTANLMKSFYSLEAVREFRVLSGVAGAEYGRMMGGVVTVATRMGTNDFHGTGFYYLQHSGLNARDILTRREHLRWGQFGVAGGGPLRRDRMFVFGSYEGGRQRKAPQWPDIFLENLEAVNGVLRQLGLREEDPGVVHRQDKDMALIRGDASWGSHQVFMRYSVFGDRETNYMAGELGAIGGLPISPNGGAEYDLRDHALVGGVTSLFGPQWVNEALFQFSTTSLRSHVPRRPNFDIVVLGFMEMGNALAYTQLPHERRWQVKEGVAYARGGRQLRFGVEYHYIQTLTQIGPTRRLIVFPNLGAFLAATPAQVQLYSDARPMGANWNLIGGFGQAQWQVGRRLMWNVGVRYEVEVVGGEAPVIVETDKNNVQPRLGMTYMLTPQTVVRAGFGVFHGTLFESYVATVDNFGRMGFPNFSPAYLQANPFARKYRPRPDNHYFVTVGGAAARDVFLDFVRTGKVPPPAGLATLVINRPDMPNPYALQWGVEIQREVGKGWGVEVGYSGVRALKMPVAINTNLMPAIAKLPNGKNDYQFPARRWDPNFSTIYVLSPLGTSTYHGLSISVRRQFAQGIGAVVNYSFSKAIDNNQGPGTFTAPEDPYRLDLDKARSSDDIPHRFVANVVAEAPERWPIWARGMQLGIILVAESGRVHNVIVGRDVNRDGQAFTDRPGILGRNTYRGPEYVSVDLRLGRKVPVGERVRVEAGIDVFNLFNRTNVLFVNTTWGSEDMSRPPQSAFGQPQKVGGARQIRLNLRVMW